MHSECNGEVSEVGLTARSLAKGGHTHAQVETHSGCRGSPQQCYCRINYRLVTGGVRLHPASRDGGRSMLTAEGSHIPNTQCTHVGSRGCHAWTYTYTLVFFVVVVFNKPHTAPVTRPTTGGCSCPLHAAQHTIRADESPGCTFIIPDVHRGVFQTVPSF